MSDPLSKAATATEIAGAVMSGRVKAAAVIDATLKRIEEDAEEADMVFDMLMGTDVPARKSFIQSHAKEATLDI